MPTDISRRAFLTGVLFAGTASAVATYFTPNGSQAAESTLQFLAGEDRTGSRVALLDMWQAGHPRVAVNAPPLRGSTADQRASMIQAIRAKNADVLALDIIDIPYFQTQGLIQPVQLPDVPFLDKTLIPSYLGNEKADAQAWAVPYNSDVGMLFTRGASDAAAPDPTLTLSSVVGGRVRNGTRQFAGQLPSSPSTSSAEAFVVNMLEHAVSGNPAVLSERGVPSDELEVWQSALQPLQQAVAAGRINACADEDKTTSTFQAQGLTYMRNWPVQYRVLQQSQDPGVMTSAVQVAEMPIGVLGGQSLAIASSCREPAAAQEFIDFMASVGAQTVLASYGLAPSVADAYNAEQLQVIVPHLQRVRGAVEHARLRPVHPNYSCFSSSIAEHLGNFLVSGQGLTTAFIEQSMGCLK